MFDKNIRQCLCHFHYTMITFGLGKYLQAVPLVQGIQQVPVALEVPNIKHKKKTEPEILLLLGASLPLSGTENLPIIYRESPVIH